MQVREWNLNSKLVSVGDRNTPAMESVKGSNKFCTRFAQTWFGSRKHLVCPKSPKLHVERYLHVNLMLMSHIPHRRLLVV